jgi:endonuclease-3 related protein
VKPRTKKDPPLREVYAVLRSAFGPQYWWPARTRLEMIVGAILTQNTAWTNVERAMRRLKRENALSVARLHAVDLRTLAEWIRPAGTFTVKARRLRAFTTLLVENFDGKLDRLFDLETPALRQRLLAVHGIGPETADCILLYAARRPVFIVDAYTKRFLARHAWLDRRAGYDETAALFEKSLPGRAPLFNEYHALIVELGKRFCRATPRCGECPLRRWLPRR